MYSLHWRENSLILSKNGDDVMNLTQAIRDRIRFLCDKNRISINKLATMSALPPSSIKNILYGKSKNPKLMTIKMLCDGLGISLYDFFDEDSFHKLDKEEN